MAPHLQVPVVLTIAGSDCSAGAGAQADLKTFSAFGVYGLTAITCVVAEVPGKVTSIQEINSKNVQEQIELSLANFPVAAIKTGLLRSRAIVEVVARVLLEHAAKSGRSLPLVIDPVMIAASGDRLLQSDAIEAYERHLFPLASLVTPNLDEATVLLSETITNLEGMRRAGARLFAKYQVPFLLKGGHLSGDVAIDLLFERGRVSEFSTPFTRGVFTHGTGCTYSAAIAANLARGSALSEAVQAAKAFVTDAIAEHFSWTIFPGADVHALNHLR